MLELGLCLALATGLRRAARARHRHALLCGVLLGYLLIADLLAALTHSAQHQIFDLFSYMFLGPLSARERGACVLLPSFALDFPLCVRGIRIAVCSLASWRCLNESAQLNPLLPRAYVLDGIAMPFAAAAVLDTLEGMVLLFAHALMAQGA